MSIRHPHAPFRRRVVIRDPGPPRIYVPDEPRLKGRAGEQYNHMRFVPRYFAKRGYLSVETELNVAPPRFWRKPNYPTLADLKDYNIGFAITKAPLVAVYPWLFAELLCLVLPWFFVVPSTLPGFVIELTPAFAVLCILYWAYMNWLSKPAVVYPEELVKYFGIIVRSPNRHPAGKISSVRPIYRSPATLRTLIGIGDLDVTFDSQTSGDTNSGLTITNVRGVESAALLIGGLAKGREGETVDYLKRLAELQATANAIQNQGMRRLQGLMERNVRGLEASMTSAGIPIPGGIRSFPGLPGYGPGETEADMTQPLDLTDTRIGPFPPLD
jgi:hypothetical protein